MADIPNYERTFAGRPDAYAAWRALAATISGGMDHRTYEIATVAAARALRSTYCSLAHGEVLLERYADRDGLRALLAAADGVGVKADARRTEHTTGPDDTATDGSTSFAAASTSPRSTVPMEDVVIVAASEPTDLPASLDTWLEGWSAEHAPGTAALVGLLKFPSPTTPASCPAWQHLQTFAHRSGQHFFASAMAARPQVPPPSRGLQPPALRSSPPLGRVNADVDASCPLRRWGLNE